jgi:hypothetical protein
MDLFWAKTIDASSTPLLPNSIIGSYNIQVNVLSALTISTIINT